LAPLPIGFAVFLVHLATIPITGTGINPARSLGAAIIYNKDHAWDDHVSTPLHHLVDLSFYMSLSLWFDCGLIVVCSGYSGSDHSLEQLLRLFTTNLSSEPFHSSPDPDLISFFIKLHCCILVCN